MRAHLHAELLPGEARPALSTPGISATWPSERQDPLIPEASGSAVLAGLGGPQSAKAGTWFVVKAGQGPWGQLKVCAPRPSLPSSPHGRPRRLRGPGWSLAWTEPRGLPGVPPRQGLPRVSLPSQTPPTPSPPCSPWFQILAASQELKDTDLEYLEVRPLVLGLPPCPCSNREARAWTSRNQVSSGSGPGFRDLEQGGGRRQRGGPRVGRGGRFWSWEPRGRGGRVLGVTQP